MSNPEKRNSSLAIFEDKEIRRILVDDEWYYSVIDVVGALTESSNPRNYWSMLKSRELENGIELYTNCVQLKMKAEDGKKRLTDCADNEGILRIIQSIPSRKAEPFKRWLARVGAERIQEIEQPSKAIERGKGYYVAQGRTPEWIQTRVAGIETRITFTDQLKESGIKKGYEYAVLTNEMYKSWSGFNASEYKDHKGLTKKESLRDNMTPMELATTIFSETAAKELIEKSGAKGFKQTKDQIHIAGNITKEALDRIEKETGKKVVTHNNMKEFDSIEGKRELIQQSLPEGTEEEKPIQPEPGNKDGKVE